MNLRSLVSLALLLMLPLSACVVVTEKSRGNVTFLWSFQGQACGMVPSVRNVKIQIGGQTLANDGVYDCSTNGTAGIVLNDFRGGAYTFTIQGRDYNGSVLYTKSGSFIVDGSVTVNVDLDAVGGGGTYAVMFWNFPPNSASSDPTCAEAGVDKVNVYIDGDQTGIAYPCADGRSANGAATPYLSVGNHTIDLSAVNAQGYEYYFKVSTLPIQSQVTSQQYDLDWAVGGATVRWTPTMSGSTTSCGVAGITSVSVNFQDAQGNLVYGSAGDPQPCMNLAVVYSFLKPGTYRVFLRANGAGSSVYESSTTAPPTVTVTAGSFTTINDGPNILLNRVQ